MTDVKKRKLFWASIPTFCAVGKYFPIGSMYGVSSSSTTCLMILQRDYTLYHSLFLSFILSQVNKVTWATSQLMMIVLIEMSCFHWCFAFLCEKQVRPWLLHITENIWMNRAIVILNPKSNSGFFIQWLLFLFYFLFYSFPQKITLKAKPNSI